jgi:cytochrome c oxidase subunit 2
MVGRVIVMEPADYERWMGGGAPGPASGTSSGEDLFTAKACHTCHRTDSTARAPMLWGLMGKTVQLEGGQTTTADETYIRESILNPAAKIVAGYQPIMPTYRGQLSEEEIIQLIQYVSSLKAPAGGETLPGETGPTSAPAVPVSGTPPAPSPVVPAAPGSAAPPAPSTSSHGAR